MASVRLPWLGIGLLLVAAFAGCLASDGSGGAGAASSPANDTAADPSPTAGPGSQGGSEGNATAEPNATDEAGNTTWRNQTRTGRFGGAKVVFGIFGDSETFPVPQDAVNLTLVVRAPDVELTGSIDPPCDSGTAGCSSERYSTASGRYTYEAQDPEAGDWTVTFFRDEGGAGSQRYILEIHREIQAGR